MALQVLSLAAYSGVATDKGIIILATGAVGDNPISYKGVGEMSIDSQYIPNYRTIPSGYQHQDAAQIIIDNGISRYKFDIQDVTNQPTWIQTVATTSGILVSGSVYRIATLLGDDDFENVGFVAEGVDFTATGTTPTHWAHSTSVLNRTVSSLEAALKRAVIYLASAAGTGVNNTATLQVNLLAAVNTIAIPSAIAEPFVYQIFEVSGGNLIAQPNIQMYQDGALWKIDLTGADPITVQINFTSI